MAGAAGDKVRGNRRVHFPGMSSAGVGRGSVLGLRAWAPKTASAGTHSALPRVSWCDVSLCHCPRGTHPETPRPQSCEKHCGGGHDQ